MCIGWTKTNLAVGETRLTARNVGPKARSLPEPILSSPPIAGVNRVTLVVSKGQVLPRKEAVAARVLA